MLQIIKRLFGLFGGNKSVKMAVAFGIGAALCYSSMAFLVKFIASHTTENTAVFFRLGVSVFLVMSMLGFKRLRGKHFSLKTKRPWLHILRAVSSFTAIVTLFISLKYVPLVSANLLAMTYNLFIPVLAFIFLGTRTSVKSWLSLGAGFVGIIFILKPGFGVFHPALLLALLTGFAIAISLICLHELTREDSVYTVIFYYFSLVFILSGVFSVFNWRTPDLNTLLVLIAIGIIGTAYQELLTRALSYASPKIVSPLLYLSVVFSGFLGWIFWGYVPDWLFLIGMVLVVLGCVFSIIYAKESLPPGTEGQ